MSIDTLTTDAPAVVLTPPPPGPSGSFTQAAFAVMGDNPDEVGVISYSGGSVVLSGYGLDGSLLFRDVLTSNATAGDAATAQLVTTGGGGVTAFWSDNDATVHSDGGIVFSGGIDLHAATSDPWLFSAPSGAFVERLYTPYSSGPSQTYVAATPIDQDGHAPGNHLTPGVHEYPYAHILIGGSDFVITDNQAALSGQAAVTIPGEPASAMTDVAAAALADGHSAAVAWVDSRTDYVSIYDAATNSFGSVIGLDWGGASDPHIVALADGGFAVSWENGGGYKGEVFDGAGDGGGILSLTGQFAAIDSHGDVYTVGVDSSGAEVVQTYAINGSGGSSGGGSAGQTFTSDDNGDVWVGTAGDDTFNLGRGGDWVAGNGGNDTYRFAAIPWAGGHITDFNAGDLLDLTGLMSTTSDAGADGFADGYLKITDDGQGDAQVWANYHIQGNDGWWLVETLDGMAPSSLTHSGDVIGIGSSAGGGGSGPTSVSTSDSSYTAPANVTSITLTGSQQHIDASATNGVTITSNDTGNVMIGGAGNDVFHLGRGGDWVAGGGGADTFAYAGTPWAGGGITDFNAAQGDEIDVSDLLAASGYTGADPFADGYLQLTSDSSGNAQLWSDIHQPGNDGLWLVATLDGVSASSLHYSGGMIT